MRLFGTFMLIATLVSGCVSSGPVMDPDPQATPIEAIAEPTDGIANEV